MSIDSTYVDRVTYHWLRNIPYHWSGMLDLLQQYKSVIYYHIVNTKDRQHNKHGNRNYNNLEGTELLQDGWDHKRHIRDRFTKSSKYYSKRMKGTLELNRKDRGDKRESTKQSKKDLKHKQATNTSYQNKNKEN
ncbi:hypothetical protein H5410_043450 [Solanum commersonii]|uniref:Uncharacterized protein n=1 Tax=Solanum commersonii TaxID=4109 RepID=A0A9J5Y0B3_SOLCO|nr:hypothetical protein H5410_043450 [Solanum commersonii]